MKISILKSVISAALTAGLLLAFAIPADAQNRMIKGTVTDENGQPMEGVTVRIEGMDITRVITPKTNKKGEYVQLLGTQVATYRVVVRTDGYQPAYKENLRPSGDEMEATADFKLTPGDSTQKLPFEMTDSDRAELQKKIEEQKKRQQLTGEVKARFEQGVTLFDSGQYKEALAEFNAALAIDQKQPGVLARAGDCYLRLNRNEEALDAYNKAIDLDSDDASLYALKGVVLSNLGKAAESHEMFTRSAELDPRGAAQNFYNLGATLYNDSKMADAADAFKRSIAADSNYAESYYLLGMCLANDDSTFSAAVDAFKKYVSIGKKAEQIQIAKEMIAALGGS